MVRIHILGGPGSGKTTFAQELSIRLHIAHYELDKMNPEKESSISIAERPAWITEGIYLIVTEPMLYHADHIVLLTVAWPVAAWRIIYRHILNSLRGTQDYPGINGIKALFMLLRGARRYYLDQNHTDRSSVEPLRMYIEAQREIAAPPTEEFAQMYSEMYREFAIPPSENFVRMYLEMHKEKVFCVKNRAERERLVEFLLKGDL